LNSEKTILIICYGFPPFPGIGGRRWAKFSKYLSSYGFNINVIASKNPFKTENNTLIKNEENCSNKIKS
jgi:hypothetical protein